MWNNLDSKVSLVATDFHRTLTKYYPSNEPIKFGVLAIKQNSLYIIDPTKVMTHLPAFWPYGMLPPYILR